MKNRTVIIPLIVILFLVTAVPAIVAITVNGNSMRKNSEEAVLESVLAKLQANQEFCDELLMQCIHEALDFILEKQYASVSNITSYRQLNSDYENVQMMQALNTVLKNSVEKSMLTHSAFFYIDGADYLMSTDRGLVRLEEYENIDWLQSIITEKRTPSGIWVPREMNTAFGGRTEVISYVYRSSSLYTTSKVSIVINIDEEKLGRLIYFEDFLLGGAGYLMDGQGNILAHSDISYLHGQAFDVLEKIRSHGGESGTIFK